MTLLGHLTRDPELKHTAGDTAVCNFDIAVNDGWGEHEHVSYFACVAWGKTAENINKFFSRGKPIMVHGEPRQDRWEDQDGNKRSKVKCNVRQFSFIAPKSPDAAGGDDLPF